MEINGIPRSAFPDSQVRTGAVREVVPLLQKALALFPKGVWLRTALADSGFFEGTFMDYLEEHALPYVVVACLNYTLKRKCAGIKKRIIPTDDAILRATRRQFSGLPGPAQTPGRSMDSRRNFYPWDIDCETPSVPAFRKHQVSICIRWHQPYPGLEAR